MINISKAIKKIQQDYLENESNEEMDIPRIQVTPWQVGNLIYEISPHCATMVQLKMLYRGEINEAPYGAVILFIPAGAKRMTSLHRITDFTGGK